MKFNKQAINNIIQMSFVQILNYAIPLIMVPYLLRTVGVVNFGKIATALAVVQLLIIISDYGFNFTATQKLAINKNVGNKLLSTIYFYKICLILFITLCLIFLILFYDSSVKEIIFIIGFYLFFLSQSLIPVWLFRGINKMIYVSLLTFTSKILSVLLLVLFVKEKVDYHLLGLIYAIPTLITMFLSFILIKKFGYKIIKISLNDVYEELNTGKDMFLSNIVGTLYTTLNPIILTYFAGPYATGLYSTCEKIIGVVNSMTNAVSQAVYPIVCQKINEKPFVKLFNYTIPASFLYFGWWPPLILLTSIILGINASLLLEIVLGSPVITEQILLLKIMFFIPLAISLGHLFGIQTLLPFNKRKSVRNSIFRGAFLNLILGTSGSIFFGSLGMGISVLICEIVVALSMLRYLLAINKEVKVNNSLTIKSKGI
jgi:polysaccharide transporter, PST family